MIDWNKIKTKMMHVSQFSNLTDQDWNRLCRAIKNEILSGTDLKGADQREAFLSKLEKRKIERRKGERRQKGDRRDFSQLKGLTEEEWDRLCKIIQQAIPQERRASKRRTGDRRKPGV